MAEVVGIGGHSQGLFSTTRNDAWWLGPLVTAAVLVTFFGYGTWAMFQGNHYFTLNYLSPLFSPVIWTVPGVAGSAPVDHALLGDWPSWWPDFALLPKSPALLILVFPGAFRGTCYYYRKAYYRSLFASPSGCAVGPAPQPGRYQGETFLLIFQNLHRYALYAAILYIPILAWDAWKGFWSPDGRFGIGVGTVVMIVNWALITGYTLGCHSWRHLVGGRLNCFSCDAHDPAPSMAFKRWRVATWFNERHMQFAWVSLVWVMFTDFYIRMVSQGVWNDLNTWGL